VEVTGHPGLRWSDTGILFISGAGVPGEGDSLASSGGYLTQMLDDDLLTETDAGYLLSWDAFFAALRRPGYQDLSSALKLPAQTDARVTLRSRGALSDIGFSISLGAWRSQTGQEMHPERVGAVLRWRGTEELMAAGQWRLLMAVAGFADRGPEERTEAFHREAWSRIRALAVESRAHLDDFLNRCVVLRPETLDIRLRRSAAVTDDAVIEIEPSFRDAPSNWLQVFDDAAGVRDRYDIPTQDGIVQVLVSANVRVVLEEIKRLPLRRVAGARAQAFIVNPYATLGEGSTEVIDERQFECAREEAGLRYERFVPVIERDSVGYPVRIGLLIEVATASGPISSETEWLKEAELREFLSVADKSVSRGFQLISWNGFELEIQGDTPEHLQILSAALLERSTPETFVRYADVHDLEAYSARVEGIGIEKPYYSIYIAKKEPGSGWFPDNVSPVVVCTPEGASEPVGIPATEAQLSALAASASEARARGEDVVSVRWLPKPISVNEAEDIARTFGAATQDIKDGAFVGGEHRPPKRNEPGRAKNLILRSNIQTLDYEERRREALGAALGDPRLPASLRADVELKPHQRHGIAWMQHLFDARDEHQVRGAVLADDMGLGKTLQLLVLMASILEQAPDADPMLVVAPVALLENWQEEVQKFFSPGALPVLLAYGEALARLRVPQSGIDERLRTEDRLTKFLRRDWVAGSRIVLTTYETLRDLEFSFAAQRWSVMVCDEAQKVKNPAAMVTRAAKKQNVHFKIACTGTPVENTLADLWCLFDFVQPGLLGPLNEFGQRYRKPIEAKSDEEKARVEELRALIAPQILRRLKVDVAKDLPKKVVDSDCRQLRLSSTQRSLYSRAVADFKGRHEDRSASPFKNHLGLIHYLRLLCTDPRRHGLTAAVFDPIEEYRRKAPKLDWLIRQLQDIKKLNEKAIVFCEFRNIQRLLQHYIAEGIGFRPDIINGDTSASSSHIASRQKRLKAFQARPGFGVIILSPLAVGFGVNLQAANHVIHYTRTWNPAKEDQATDRAHRIGQEKDVHVYYPVVVADDFETFDVKLDQLLERKRVLSNDMLNGAADVGPGDFSVADVVPEADREGLDEPVTIEMAMKMDWRYFEILTGVLWAKRGFQCYQTPNTRDNGVDVVALQGAVGELIQAKTSATPGASVGWDAVKEVVGGAALYERRHPSVTFSKVCITNQAFNAQAHENAALNGVALMEQKDLAAMLAEHPVNLSEVDGAMFPDWNESAGVH